MEKIAFVGTMCTGKTTLFNELKKRVQAVFVEEAARQVLKENPDVSTSQIDLQFAIQRRAVENDKLADKGDPKLIICDRSVIDALMYMRYLGYREDSQRLLDEVRPRLSTYNKFYLLDPSDVQAETDSERVETQDFRDKLYREFLNFFAEENIEYTLLSGSVQERLEQVMNYLNTSPTKQAKADKG